MLFSRLLSLAVSVIHPAIGTFKSLNRKDPRSHRVWLRYWTTFACFLVGETVGDAFLLPYIVPCYDEMKLALLVWAVNPWTRGFEIVYRKLVHPFLRRHEREFDSLALSSCTFCMRHVRAFLRHAMFAVGDAISVAVTGRRQYAQGRSAIAQGENVSVTHRHRIRSLSRGRLQMRQSRYESIEEQEVGEPETSFTWNAFEDEEDATNWGYRFPRGIHEMQGETWGRLEPRTEDSSDYDSDNVRSVETPVKVETMEEEEEEEDEVLIEERPRRARNRAPREAATSLPGGDESVDDDVDPFPVVTRRTRATKTATAAKWATNRGNPRKKKNA